MAVIDHKTAVPYCIIWHREDEILGDFLDTFE